MSVSNAAAPRTRARRGQSPGDRFPWEVDPRRVDDLIRTFADRVQPDGPAAVERFLAAPEHVRASFRDLWAQWRDYVDAVAVDHVIPGRYSPTGETLLELGVQFVGALEVRAPAAHKALGGDGPAVAVALVLLEVDHFLAQTGPDHDTLRAHPGMQRCDPHAFLRRFRETLSGDDLERFNAYQKRRVERFLESVTRAKLGRAMTPARLRRLGKRGLRTDVALDVETLAAWAARLDTPTCAEIATGFREGDAPASPGVVLRHFATFRNNNERRRGTDDEDALAAADAEESLRIARDMEIVAADSAHAIDHAARCRAVARELLSHRRSEACRYWLTSIAETGAEPANLDDAARACGVKVARMEEGRAEARRLIRKAISRR